MVKIATNILNFLKNLFYTKSEVDSKLGGKSDSGHSHSNASTSSSGFLSASDKSKLDGISTGANKTVVDSALSSSSTNPVQNKVINTALSGKANSSHTHDDRYYTEAEIDEKLGDIETILNDIVGV